MVSTSPLISNLAISVQILWWLYRVHQLQLVSPSFSCSIIIIIPCEFFTPALVDDFSLESEGLQISSSLQDSSQYSGRS